MYPFPKTTIALVMIIHLKKKLKDFHQKKVWLLSFEIHLVQKLFKIGDGLSNLNNLMRNIATIM